MSKEVLEQAGQVVEKAIVKRFLRDSDRAVSTGKQKDLKRAENWSEFLNEPNPQDSWDDKSLPKDERRPKE